MVPATTMRLNEQQTSVSNKERLAVDEASKVAMATKKISQNVARPSHPPQLIQAGILALPCIY